MEEKNFFIKSYGKINIIIILFLGLVIINNISMVLITIVRMGLLGIVNDGSLINIISRLFFIYILYRILQLDKSAVYSFYIIQFIMAIVSWDYENGDVWPYMFTAMIFSCLFYLLLQLKRNGIKAMDLFK